MIRFSPILIILLIAAILLSCEDEEHPTPPSGVTASSKLGLEIKLNTVSYRSAGVTVDFTNVTNQVVLEVGVVWDTATDLSFEKNHISLGSRLAQKQTVITGLLPKVTYYVSTYVKISDATILYSEQVSFTTLEGELPIITSAQVDTVQVTTIKISGEIDFGSGELEIADKGVCWSTSPNPTLEDQIETGGTGAGAFLVIISELDSLSTYYLRPYATNRKGSVYGDEFVIRTKSLPVLSTVAVVDEEGGNATSGGSVTDDGGYDVTSRGVVWSTSHSPTIADNKTIDGEGIGTFTSSITDLAPSTTYYVRAYATNGAGTRYGEEFSLTTTDGLPIVVTKSFDAFTGWGEVTSDRGYRVTSRGVVWGTSQNPTAADNRTEEGAGIGIFYSTISDLVPGVTYYLRAYATNVNGTSYGDEISLTARDPMVGDLYHGGIIGYILQAEDEGYIAGEVHGLIVAPSDLGKATWGCEDISISGADGAGVGTGAQNTRDILLSCSEDGIAAQLCANLSLDGYDDWFLPSIEEFKKLSLNKVFIDATSVATIGNSISKSGNYWSSTEYGNIFVFHDPFGYMGSAYHYSIKSREYNVMAVRAF